MNHLKRGAGSVGIIVGIVVVVLAIGVVAYFASDVFRTKVDSSVEQATKWTPENIAKDPINYLNYCETETEKALEKLKASEISIAQKKASLANMRDTAKGKVNAGEKALNELRDAYKTAEAGDAFPFTWMGQEFSQDRAKKQIMDTHRQVESQRNVLGKTEQGIRQLEQQASKIVDQRANCEEQLTQIATNREILKVQEITDDLTEQLVSMQGVMQATVAVVSETDTGSISLDAIAAESASTVDDDEFLKVLEGGG